MRAEESPNTTQALLAAAKKVFAAHGFDGATIKEIAEEAGCNVSLVSYHFGGKEGLYRACLEQFGSQRVASAERILQQASSAEELKIRLALFLEEFVAHHYAEPDVSAIVHRDCVRMDDAVIQSVFSKHFMKMFARVTEFFTNARDHGVLRRDIDPMIVSGLFLGGFVHVLQTEPLARKHFGVSLADPKFRKKLIEHAIGTLLDGVLPRGAP